MMQNFTNEFKNEKNNLIFKENWLPNHLHPSLSFKEQLILPLLNLNLSIKFNFNFFYI